MTGAEEGRGGTELTGVVLAGGLSSRLGHDKARIRLVSEDEPDFLARAAALLAGCCGRVLILGREHPNYESYPDAVPGCGPVGGISTALGLCASACLVLSCDMPFMERGLLERLAAAHAGRPAGALSTSYRQKDTGHVEALVAIYEKEALPFFEACIRERRLKISQALPPDKQYFLEYSAEEALPFFNVNYPADLLVARKVMQMLGH